MASVAYVLEEPVLSRTLGAIIGEWKSRTGRSAEDLAKLIGCSERSAFAWQSDHAGPQSKYHPALMRELDLTGEELRDAIAAGEQMRTRETPLQLHREGVEADTFKSDWVNAVGMDQGLSLLARTALLIIPEFLVLPATRQIAIVPRNLVGKIREITTENVDDVWDEIVNSGHLAPSRQNPNVYTMVLRK